MTSPSTDRLFGSNSSLAIKAPCVAGTTANITLSGEQTLDGVAVVTDDRVLVKDQTDTTENGIYIADTSDWQRTPDFDGTRDIVKGTLIRVSGGSTLTDSYWTISSPNPITIGTSSITFTQSNNALIGVSAFGAVWINLANAAAGITALGIVQPSTQGAIVAGGISGNPTQFTGSNAGKMLMTGTGSATTMQWSYETSPRMLRNVGIGVSMSGNAVTLSLRGANGNNPDADNPVTVGFRSVTANNGSATQVNVTSTTSVAISSGSTGGTVSGAAARIWIAAINNAGTLELAWFNALSGTNIATIDEGQLISTTAEGGAGAADSAQVWYSTTARSNVAFTVLGYFDSTQATAGTWASNPSLQVCNPTQRPGQIIQRVSSRTGAVTVSASATIMPLDNSVPQSGEGEQYLSQAITPIAAANILKISSTVHIAHSAGASMHAALFQDATAGALSSSISQAGNVNLVENISFTHDMKAATTSSTTFKVRAGNSNAGNTTFNGASGTVVDTTLASHLTIEEVMS